jgi:hypothetical protein
LFERLLLKLKFPWIQYLAGVFINIIVVLILVSNNSSYKNLQTPEDFYASNLWNGSDVMTYVSPARNYINFGVFGWGNTPDYHRTVGYPLFLSILMIIFHDNWLLFVFFAQAFICASVYPALLKISSNLLDIQDNVGSSSFIFFIVSGTYIAMVPVIMTDLFFSVLFTVGLYFGLESVRKRSCIYLALHVIFIGYSAQVRPLLAVYPIINFFLLLYMSTKCYTVRRAKTYMVYTVATAFLVILCNFPSIRNYVNYGFGDPSDVLYNNMFDFLAYSVIKNAGKINEYNALQDNLKDVNTISEKMRLKKRLAISIYREYPYLTLAQMTKNAIGIMLRAHWSIIANFWEYNFKDNFERVTPLRKSNFVFALECLFNVVYLIVYCLFLAFLIRLFRLREYMLLLIIISFTSYFLVPAFMVNGAGSRMRLPVEGIIVLASMSELEQRLWILKDRIPVRKRIASFS